MRPINANPSGCGSANTNRDTEPGTATMSAAVGFPKASDRTTKWVPRERTSEIRESNSAAHAPPAFTTRRVRRTCCSPVRSSTTVTLPAATLTARVWVRIRAP